MNSTNLANLPSSIYFYPEDHANNDDCSEITEPLLVVDRSNSARHFMTAEQQEILELKQQLARQQQKINSLEVKLIQCQLEKEELEASNAVLIEEATDAQMPTDAQQAKLLRENARLQVVSDIMRKTFKKSSDEARRKSESDKQTIKALEKENKMLRYRVLYYSRDDVNQGIIEFGSSGNSAHENYTLEDDIEQEDREEMQEPKPQVLPSRKVSRRDTGLSKSNNTAPTYLISEGDDNEGDQHPIDPPEVSSKSINGNEATVVKGQVNKEIKDIDSEELKQVIPWLKWAVKARTPTPRAA